jgi:hypothetical protein
VTSNFSGSLRVGSNRKKASLRPGLSSTLCGCAGNDLRVAVAINGAIIVGALGVAKH